MEEGKKEDTTSETNEATDETVVENVEGEGDKKPDFKKKADAMYGKYQEEKKLREELEKKLEAKEEAKAEPLDDIEKIAQVTSALSGLDKTEQARLMAEAKMKGISLLKAKEDEDFLLWKKAHNDKVEEEKKEIKPSTKQETVEGDKPLSEMTIDEKEEHFQKIGLIRNPKSYEKKWKKK